MIFPKGQMVYENMNTSFTNFGELLLNLSANSFTGYVRISFLDYEGILFLDGGNVVNAVEEAEGKRATSQKAVNSITRHAKERDGAISVYRLSAEMVTMLASVVKSAVIYENLTTDLTGLDKLVAKLQGEDHTGYIEVEMKDGKGSGIIFIQTGDPIESIFSTNGDVVSGSQVLPQMIETSSKMGASFNVYKADAKKIFAESTEIMAGFELPQLLEVWQEIIATVERVVDRLSSTGHFVNAFKDTLIEKAHDYPFLDPFAKEFEYKKGTIDFQGESVKDFSKGLGECLSATIGNLAAKMPEADLAAEVRTELQAMKEKYVETIEKFSLEAAMPEYLA